MDSFGLFKISNTVTSATVLGVGLEDIVGFQRGSPELSQSMLLGAVDGLQGTLIGKINGKLSALRQSIEAIGEVPERGVSILNIFRQQEIPVMTLLDKLREMPVNEDPVLYLINRGFPKDFLEKLGLHEGMSKGECQEILSRHFQEILEKVGVESGVRNLGKLAVHGEDHYRKRSAGLELASTITRGMSDIAAKPMGWIAHGVVSVAAKLFKIDPDKLPDTQTVKAVSAAAALVLTICIPTCPPLAIAVGVMFGVFLLFRGVSAILELANESFAKSCLEGKNDAWTQFCSNLSRKISVTMDDVAPAAAPVVGIMIPGTIGQVFTAAGQGIPESTGVASTTVPADEASPPPSSIPVRPAVPPVVTRPTVPDVD